MEIPDGGLVYMCRTLEGSFLCHSVTRERRRLPEDVLAVRISTNGDNYTVVTIDGISQWANDWLCLGLARLDDGQLILLDGDKAMPLQDYLWSHERTHVPIAFVGKETLLTVYKFAQTQVDGGLIWWGLSSLWCAMQVQDLKAHQWLSNWLRWWRRRFEKLGLERAHLRPSCVARGGPAEREDGGDAGEQSGPSVSERCLPELSCSTLGLLLLVSRFANGSHYKKKQEVAGVWAALFRSLCRECLPPAFSIGLSADEGFKVKTGFSSAPAVVLQCDGDVAKVGSLVAHPSRLAVGDNISLVELAFHLGTTNDSHLLLQMLWQVASAMEQKILGSSAQHGVIQVARSARSASQNARFGKLSKAASRRILDNRKDLVCRYFFAGRKSFEQKGVLSLSTDATRLGKRSVLVTALALPDNTMMWTPPQALRGVGAAAVASRHRA